MDEFLLQVDWSLSMLFQREQLPEKERNVSQDTTPAFRGRTTSTLYSVFAFDIIVQSLNLKREEQIKKYPYIWE